MNIKLLLTLLLLTSCSIAKIKDSYRPLLDKNKYSEFDITTREQDAPPTIHKIIDIRNILNDELTEEYLSRGYIIVGYNQLLTDGSIEEEDYISYAKSFQKEVDTIIYAYQYLGSSTTNLSFETPTSTTTNHSGTINSNKGLNNINYSGTSTTYGTKTSIIPITNYYYTNEAIYLAKSNICQKLKFGFNYVYADKSIQKAAGTREIFKITRVCEGSVAYKRGLFTGDHFIINKNKRGIATGKTVNLTVIRGEQIIKVLLEL